MLHYCILNFIIYGLFNVFQVIFVINKPLKEPKRKNEENSKLNNNSFI